MAALGPKQAPGGNNKQTNEAGVALTNGYAHGEGENGEFANNIHAATAAKLKERMSSGADAPTPPNGTSSPAESNGGPGYMGPGGGPPGPGGGPPGPGHYPGHPYYGQYGQAPHGYPPKPGQPPGPGGYPAQRFPSGQAISQAGGPTPTLNSLLQDRNQRFPSNYEGGGGPPPPGSHGYPGWGHGYPGYRGQGPPRPPYGYGPQGGPGGYPGYPGGLPGQRYSEPGYGPGAPPSRSPGPRPPYSSAEGPRPPYSSSEGPRPPYSSEGPRPSYSSEGHRPSYSSDGPRPPYPQGYGPPRPGGPGGPPFGGPRPAGPPHGPSPDRPPNSSPSPNPPNTEGVNPPHPGKHEGPPASTWTPPIQGGKGGAPPPSHTQQGPPTSQQTLGPPQSEQDGGKSPDDGRPGSAEPGLRPTPSPRPGDQAHPSPSPTGSSSSRSMSPAVGHQRDGASVSMPPRPASGASDGSGPTSASSPMATPAPGQGYHGQPAMGPPPHMYKGGYPGGPVPPPGQGVPPYGHGYPGYNQGPRPGYGPGPGYGPYGGPRNSSPGGPGGPPGQYPGYPQGQYPPQGWNGPSPNMMAGGKGTPPPGAPGPPRHQGPPGAAMRMAGPGFGPGGPQKMPGPFPGQPGGPPSSYNGPSGPSGQYNGPSMPPPSSSSPGMGPPTVSSPSYSSGPPVSSPAPYSGPPSSSPSYQGGYPPGAGPPVGYPGPNPPSTTPNSVPPPSSTPSSMANHDGASSTPPRSSDSPVTSNSQAGMATPSVTNSVGGPTATTLVATGPDGQPMLDETSQQSTLSQSSDHSGGRQTPKGSYMNPQGFPHPPGTPGAPSPGGSMGSAADDGYRDVSSPHGWPRHGGPGSPVGGPPPSQSKVENLARLYEIDDHPERRRWLDQLLGFMEERNTPIAQCPTISKNPLDLYRLYLYTKERGGFLECTKNKAWKDIAAQLGIGPSSSGAYTLKKHYGKNLLPYECHFERGGIDPGPILAQVEAQSKKKGKSAQAAQTASAPSPAGSQDSRDSFTGNSQDGYGGYPSGYNYPPNDPRSGPPPHQGMGAPGYPPSSGYSGQYPPQHRPPGPDGYPGGHGPGGASPYGGNTYSGQGPPPRWGPPGQYDQNSGPNTNQEMYTRGWNGAGYPARPGYPGAPPVSTTGPQGQPTQTNNYPTGQQYPDQFQKGGIRPGGPPGPGAGPPGPGGPPGPRIMSRPPQPGGPSHPVILRANSPATPGSVDDSLPMALPVQRIPNPHGYTGGVPPGSGPPGGPMPPPGGPQRYPGGPPGAPNTPGMPPSSQSLNPSGPPVSRGSPFPGPFQGPRPPMYPGAPGPNWQNNFPPRGYPSAGPPGAPRPSGPPGAPWTDGRPGPFGPQYTGGPRPGPPGTEWSPRPGPRPPFPSRGPMGPGGSGPQRPMVPGGRREMYNFPPDSLEATQPLLVKRKKLSKVDVQPVEGWRMVMALRSGLLMESTWALDTMNILLYDDNSVAYFGLGNMPGLLEALLEHWRASLIAMFDITKDLEVTNAKTDEMRKRKRSRIEKSTEGVKWYEPRSKIPDEEVDLGSIDNEELWRGEKVRILHHQPNDFTKYPRFSTAEDMEFQIDDCEDTLFLLDEVRDWDSTNSGFHSGLEVWAAGGGLETDHIISAVGPCLDTGVVPFVRVLKDLRVGDGVKTPTTSNKAVTNSNSNNASDGLNHKNNSDVTSPGKTPKKKVPRETWKVSTIKTENEKPTPASNGTSSFSVTNLTNSSSTDVKDAKTKSTTESASSSSTAVSADQATSDSAVKLEPEQEQTEDVVESVMKRTGILLKEKDTLRKRWVEPILEEENYQPDMPSLSLVSESQDNIGKRAIAVSNIFRNLSFVPGNESHLGSCPTFLTICGKLLLLHHWHPQRTTKQRNYDRGEEEDFSESCTSLSDQTEWWWDHLQVIRENVMVALTNIAGHCEFSDFPEELVRPLLSGLLEWAVSPSAVAQDPFPNVGPASPVSPQRLALEALCKFCIQETNVDLLLTTPPFSRIERLCSLLTKKLYRFEEQVLREFAINMLFYLSSADSGVARTIAQQDSTVSLLIGFIEQAESNALMVAQQHGVNALRDNPDSMGTSLDMLRRAANTLYHLARHPDNNPLFVRQEARLLNLVMSQILDQGVAGILSQVLFTVSRT